MSPRRRHLQLEQAGAGPRELTPAQTEALMRPPFSAPLAARELRYRADHSADGRVVVSADFARALADALDPKRPSVTPCP